MRIRRLIPPLAAYLLLGAFLWLGARFEVAEADALDIVNNGCVASGIRTWGAFPAVTAVNPLEGMASLFMPLNPWIAPRSAPLESTTSFADPFLPSVSHRPFGAHALLWLAWLMAGAYALARSVRAGVLTAALCAQAAAVAVLPPAGQLFFKSQSSFVMNPPLVVPVALCLATLGVLWRARPAGAAATAALAAGLLALVTATLWADPLFAALFFVVLLPFFGAALLDGLPAAVAAWRRDRSLAGALATPPARKVAAGLAAVAVLKLAGPLDFVAAIARYTARQQFPGEVHGEIQVAEFANFPFGSAPQMVLALLLAGGCLAAALLLRGRRRVLGAVALAHLAALAGLGAVYLQHRFLWRYPLPLYLEIPSLPVYAVAALCGYAALSSRALAAARRRFRAVRGRPGARRTARRLLPALIPGASLLALLAMIGSVPAIWKLLVAEPLTVLSSVDRLAADPEGFLERVRREIGLRPGDTFRGRMATIVGVSGTGIERLIRSERKQPFNKWYWKDIGDQLGNLAPADFTTIPWTRGIPTVGEYSHLVSPPYYYFFSRLLNRQGDFQSRNILWPTVANVDALAAMGVRYLVTDAASALPGLRRDAAVNVADTGLGINLWLYLYELADPNRGQYSPTRVSVAPDARGIVRRLRAPDFDWRREVVLTEAPAGPLVPLQRLELRFLPNALRVEAASAGRSLALLPVEFSRCWVADDPGVRLVRANLAMTGLLFEGRVSTTIRFRFGFFSPGGRLRDLAEVRALDLAPDGWVGYPDFLLGPAPRRQP